MKIGILGCGKLGMSLARLLCLDGIKPYLFSNRQNNETTAEEQTPLHASLLFSGEYMLDALFLAHPSTRAEREEQLQLSHYYHTVSAYDMHSDLAPLKAQTDKVAKESGTVAIIGVGWDPGLLSLARAICYATFPKSSVQTKWGVGVSEGHSAAIRKIPGVIKAIQYTHPTATSHRRVCYVVCERGEEGRIEECIRNMPEYFLPYDTEVHFIGNEEFEREHEGVLFHRGCVSVKDSLTDNTSISVEVRMQHNPTFTARVMLAYLSALWRIKKEGKCGAFGPLDIPLSYLLEKEQSFLW